MSKSRGSIGGGMNNLLLGIADVFNKKEKALYLKSRFEKWNIQGPSGYSPHLHKLPIMCSPENLPIVGEGKASLKRELEKRKQCLQSNLDFYFPLLKGEKVKEDYYSFLTAPFASYPPGTVVAKRTTNKAVMFAVVADWRFDLEVRKLTNVFPRVAPKSEILSQKMLGAGEEIKLLTSILGIFAGTLSGGAGVAAKIGVNLLSYVLGMAGSSGPSWSQMKDMMKQVVREELITNDLEHVQAAYESVKRWSDITYLPNKSAGKTKKELWNMLSPQINLVHQQISLLLQQNHRIPGFALLLLGVSMYLALLQEQISLSYPAKIQDAGMQWADDMVKVWKEVQNDRYKQIKVKRYSYSVPEPSHTVITCFFWSWEDKKSNQSKGSRNGPWQEAKKNSHEADCRKDAEKHYQDVLLDMVNTFADPVVTAAKWRNVIAS